MQGVRPKKETGMDWLFSIVRIAGASFPGSASFVQLQGEIETKKILNRVQQLEDPISFLHEKAPEVSKRLYEKMKAEDSNLVEFEREFYEQYSRPLAALESQGLIRGNHGLDNSYSAGILFIDPSYIMYMCALCEDPTKMETLFKLVDECKPRGFIDGKKTGIDLPLPAIEAVFQIFESKGYGLYDQTIGVSHYTGVA